MPSRSQAARSSVLSTSSNQPTFRCVAPHALVCRMGWAASVAERASTAICALFSNASTAPQSTERQVSDKAVSLTVGYSAVLVDPSARLARRGTEDALAHGGGLGGHARLEHLGAGALGVGVLGRGGRRPLG